MALFPSHAFQMPKTSKHTRHGLSGARLRNQAMPWSARTDNSDELDGPWTSLFLRVSSQMFDDVTRVTSCEESRPEFSFFCIDAEKDGCLSTAKCCIERFGGNIC